MRLNSTPLTTKIISKINNGNLKPPVIGNSDNSIIPSPLMNNIFDNDIKTQEE